MMPQNLYKNLTASGLVKTGYGSVEGIIISSHTGGTIKLWDSLTATGATLVDTITLNVGERFIPCYDAGYTVGLFVTIGGTAIITVVYS
jgi:hypothetical protein